MFKDETVDLIYCCHALEYFDREDAQQKVLPEWYRVLKHNGILHLAVPDFEAIVKVYLKYRNLNHRGILGPLYGRIVVDGIKYHKCTYDFPSLKKVLELVGFREILRYDWRKTIYKDYDDFSQAYIPHMDKEHGILISLNIEAKKP